MVERAAKKEGTAPKVTPKLVADRLAELHGLLQSSQLPSVTIEVAEGLLGDVPSWTERAFTAVVKKGRSVTVAAAYDTADPYRDQILKAKKGDVVWDYFGKDAVPKWVGNALQVIGFSI